MANRRRCFAPLVALVTAAYLVTSLGCAAARVRPAASNDISQSAAGHDVALASYAPAASQGQQPLLTATDDDVAQGQIDVDQIVRGQDDHGYGPIREFLISPWTIGAIFVAALIVPAAIEGNTSPLVP